MIVSSEYFQYDTGRKDFRFHCEFFTKLEMIQNAFLWDHLQRFFCCRVESMTQTPMGSTRGGDFVLNPKVMEVEKARDCLTPMG